jgi:hypothetical protein
VRAELAVLPNIELIEGFLGKETNLLTQVVKIRDATEDVFLTTGSQLVELSSLLDTARAGANSLDKIVRSGLLGRLRDEALAQSRSFDELTRGFQKVDAGIEALNCKLRELGADLEDVRRSVVMMRMVVLNVRVTLASLHAQDQSLNNFAEDGQNVVAEIVELLNRLESAMPDIRDLVGRVALEVAYIRDSLEMCVLVAFRQLMQDVGSFEAGARSVSGEGQALSARIQLLIAATAAAVSGFQIGDSTRQQLDHVEFILSQPEAGDPVLKNLAASLLIDAANFHGRALTSLRNSVGQMINGMKDLYQFHLVGFLAALGESAKPEILLEGVGRLELSIRKLQPLQAKAEELEQAMTAEFNAFRDLIGEGEKVQQSTRQIGINAVLSCTRLGSGGQALKVVAEQLQLVAREVGARFSAMRRTLDSINDLGIEINSSIGRALRNSIELPERLASSLQPLVLEVTESLVPVNVAVARLCEKIENLELDFGPAQGHWSQLQELANGLAPCSVPIKSDHLPDELLAGIAKRFTIERERDVFRTVLPNRSGLLTQAPTIASTSNLDDGFLF